MLFHLNPSILLIPGEDFGLMNTEVAWHSAGIRSSPPKNPISYLKCKNKQPYLQESWPDFPKSLQIRSWPWSTPPVVSESSVCTNTVYSMRKPYLYGQDSHPGAAFTRLSVCSNITTHNPNPNPAGEHSFELRGLRHAHLYTLLNLSLTSITVFIFCTNQVFSIYLLVFEKLKVLHQGTEVVILVINCTRQVQKNGLLVPHRMTQIMSLQFAIRNLQWRHGKEQINSRSKLLTNNLTTINLKQTSENVTVQG